MDGTIKAALWASLIAFGIHLVPVFLPRKVPAVELNLARLLPTPEDRLHILLPLLDNAQTRPEHLRQAAELVLGETSEHARRFLAEAERFGPSVENELLRARICHHDGDDACVAAALVRAREMAPEDPRPDLLQAEFARAAGDMPAYVFALGRAWSLGRDPELGLRYARGLAQLQRLEDAERVLHTVGPRLGRGRMELEEGLLLLGAGRLGEAEALLEGAVASDPRNAEAHYLLGVVRHREGKLEAAQQALERADRLNPADFRPLALICALQLERAQITDAAVTRSLLERRFPEDRAAYAKACPP